MTDEFMAISGLDAEQAQFYLEMAGFDTETALQFYFSSCDGGSSMGGVPDTSGGVGGGAASGGRSLTNENLRDIVFPAGGVVHEAWLVQGLLPCGRAVGASGLVFPNHWAQLGIVQPKNGPCGVVAAYMGSVVVALLERGGLQPGVQAEDTDLIRGLVNILSKATGVDPGGAHVFQVCTWKDPAVVDGALAITTAATEAELTQLLSTCLIQFLSPGGAMLLVYSAVATYGATRFESLRDVIPLVYNYESLPFQLCSSALMGLLLAGQPRESLGAYDPLAGQKLEWVGQVPLMGFISGSEKELKMRVHDAFKTPEHDIYVLHGRDHFTLAFRVPQTPPTQSPQSEATEFSLVHWNGLPPAGPLCSTMTVIAAEGACQPAPPTAAEGVGKEYKPVVGSIDSVIQADKTDKDTHPKEWKKWRYEVALAVDDPTDASEPRPTDLPMPKVFSLNPADIVNGMPWRCRSCYQTRYTTMCFGQNEAGELCCQHCGQTRESAGWTLWMPYEELPRTWRGSVDRQHGPLILTVLRTKWENCELLFDGAGTPSV